MSRNENAQKKQHCEDEETFELYDNFEKFEYDITSKEIQTTPDQKYWGTNRHLYHEKYIQCNIQNDIEMYASQKYSDESDNESIDDMDS